GDAPRHLARRGELLADRPYAGEPPAVGGQRTGPIEIGLVLAHAARRDEAFAARIADIGLRRLEPGPVRRQFQALAVDDDRGAVEIAGSGFGQQRLDDALGFLILAFAELLVADAPLRVDEIERRPVLVVEGAPDRVVVVDHHRIGDPRVL